MLQLLFASKITLVEAVSKSLVLNTTGACVLQKVGQTSSKT